MTEPTTGDTDPEEQDPSLSEEDGAAEETALTPRRLKKKRKDELSSWGVAMVGDAGRLEWIIRGPRDATLGTIKAALQLLENLYRSFEADPAAQTIAIAQSVHITVEPSEDERISAEMVLDELGRLEEEESIEQAPAVVADPESGGGTDTEYEKLRRDSVPNTLLANSLLVDLIEETLPEDSEPLEAALRYGTGVAKSYRTFVAGLGDAGLEVEAISETEGRSVRVPAERLEQLKEALSREGREESFNATVAGVLSMADAAKLEFRIDFAGDVPRPDVLREWRGPSIGGHYTEQMKTSISDRGLWGKEVLARLKITREARGSSAARRRPDVELTDVRLRYDG